MGGDSSSRSANSRQQRSKRSRHSSSNNSSNSNSKNKNSKQKTLGMAWGANSLSASRSSFRSSPFSDFGSYMTEKNRKLHHQFVAEASNSSDCGLGSAKQIFHGVSIFVDGFTVPSSQELRHHMLKYGGRFENYFSRHIVTHIICSNLPDSKIKNLRSFSCGLPVVKPSWITDSIVANKLLSWVPYQLDQLANSQPKVSAFFPVKSCSISEGVSTVAVSDLNLDPSLNGSMPRNEDYSEVGAHIDDGKQMDKKFGSPEHGVDELCNTTGKCLESRTSKASISETDYGNSANNELQYNLHDVSASHRSYTLDSQNVKGSPNSSFVGPSNRCHSTLEDANFVENYFKSSRLHFIGTWRNRYSKRFATLSSELRCTSSNVNASANSKERQIIHVDLDCFFVSVVIKNHPELHDNPVAVCHSDNPKGTAEISSANYPARDYGVVAGMFVRDAKALCPQLIIFPYNFEAYEEVADQFYDILHKHCNKVQAVSCDEAFLDITDLEGVDPDIFTSSIRKDIFEATGCAASAGIAGNMLMACLATRTAKPNGQFHIPHDKVDEYLQHLPIGALPGIGYVLEEKLKKRNVWNCGQLRLISKDSLQRDFGLKTGEMLWNYSRGVDNRLVGIIQEPKSIGAEVNWGVRFKDSQDSQYFLLNLCKEVSLRLQECGVQGRTFTLKIKKKKENAGEPAKYMGCGECENLSHSVTVPIATDNPNVLQRITKQLFGSFGVDVKDIRGVGLQVSKLENADASKQGLERNSLRMWLTSASASNDDHYNSGSTSKNRVNADSEVHSIIGTLGQLSADQSRFSAQMDNNLSSFNARCSQVSAPPPLGLLDMEVVESLPTEFFSELNEIYGGKLMDFISRSKVKSENSSGSPFSASHEQVQGTINVGEGIIRPDMDPQSTVLLEKKHADERSTSVFGSRSHNEAINSKACENTDLMPSSLSQVDPLVLQQLPEDLRVDILGQIPAHRRQELTSNAAFGSLEENPQKLLDIKISEFHLPQIGKVTKNNLWLGNPPRWVDEFKASNCLILNSLAVMYYKFGSSGNLSSILQRATTEWQYHLDGGHDDRSDEATYYLCELFKQYIKLKIELDIEELYVCFRLLKRFMAKSKFFSQVYNNVFPYLQAAVGEVYGGNLNVSPND